LEFLFPGADPATITLLHSYIRKFAHFFEYAVLAVLAVNAVTRFALRSAYWLHYTIAFGVVLVTAILDEGNQSFSRSRTGSAYDVLLDCFGGAAALLAVYVLTRYRSPVTRHASG
jgi:VanZ family protein